MTEISTPNNLSIDQRNEVFEVAVEAVSAAKTLILNYWSTKNFTVLHKEDKSPVTQVDTDAERVMRQIISRHFPEHGILGEELHGVHGESPYQWILDPIDGTQNFLNGLSTFGTMLAVCYQGIPFVGIIDHPVLGIQFSAASGLGVFKNGQPFSAVIDKAAVLRSDDLLVMSPLVDFERTLDEQVMVDLMKFHSGVRIFYDPYGATCAFQGNVAACVDINMHQWDILAAEVIIRELGGALEYVRNFRDSKNAVISSSVFGLNKSKVRQLAAFMQEKLRKPELCK